MGVQVKISKWGNSLAVRLPKALAEELGLKEGDTAEFAVEGRKAAFTPVSADPAYATLDEMIAEMKRLGGRTAYVRDHSNEVWPVLDSEWPAYDEDSAT